MRRVVAMILCGVLSLSLLTGCGNTKDQKNEVSTETSTSQAASSAESQSAEESTEVAEKTYDEKLSITTTSCYSLYNSALGIDYTQDPLYEYVAEKFNVDLDFWALEFNNAAEKMRTWISSGTMPDMTLWLSFSFPEYYEYIDQGLIQPLPDGWETKWPNLARLVEASGMSELLKVDGQTYAVPHAIFGNFLDIDEGIHHTSLFFRKDWAEAVGMSDMGDDYTVTLSELKEYLEKVKDAGLADMPTIGGQASTMHVLFKLLSKVHTTQWIETEDGFVWGPTIEEYPDAVALEQEWYQTGLLDSDFYTQPQSYYQSAMSSGQLAACYAEGAAQNYQSLVEAYEENFPEEENAYDVIGIAQMVSDDGTSCINVDYNYWTAHVFSPATDEETLERILDMMDWFSSEEGQVSVAMGVPGEHWEYDADGNIISLVAEGEETGANKGQIFELWGYCNDDFAYSGFDPKRDIEAVEAVKAIYAVKEAGTKFSVNAKYDAYQSDAKKAFSAGIAGKITEIVCSGLDVKTEWAKYVEEYYNMWKPLQDELNAYYGY